MDIASKRSNGPLLPTELHRSSAGKFFASVRFGPEAAEIITMFIGAKGTKVCIAFGDVAGQRGDRVDGDVAAVEACERDEFRDRHWRSSRLINNQM